MDKKISTSFAVLGIIIFYILVGGGIFYSVKDVINESAEGSSATPNLEKFCSDASYDVPYFDFCPLIKSFFGKDYNFCDDCKVPDYSKGEYRPGRCNNEKGNCISIISIVRNDLETCEGLPSPTACLSGIAFVRQDEKICQKIVDDQIEYNPSDLSARGGCIMHIAVSKNDLEMCDTIHSSGDREGCYAFIAVKRGDQSICDKITTHQWDIDYCYTNLRKNIVWSDNFISPSSSWMNYKNEKYGFEIKYPKELMFTDRGTAIAWQGNNSMFDLSFLDLGLDIYVMRKIDFQDLCKNNLTVSSVGSNITALETSAGKMGWQETDYFVLTNKDYVFLIRKDESYSGNGRSFIPDDKRAELSGEMIKTFNLIGDTEAISCSEAS
ncbi:MAG: hypothetical protein WC845_03245 [Candidatus Staskawiczbacteria bacterium]|jgi:hypothetical protein